MSVGDSQKSPTVDKMQKGALVKAERLAGSSNGKISSLAIEFLKKAGGGISSSILMSSYSQIKKQVESSLTPEGVWNIDIDYDRSRQFEEGEGKELLLKKVQSNDPLDAATALALAERTDLKIDNEQSIIDKLSNDKNVAYRFLALSYLRHGDKELSENQIRSVLEIPVAEFSTWTQRNPFIFGQKLAPEKLIPFVTTLESAASLNALSILAVMQKVPLSLEEKLATFFENGNAEVKEKLLKIAYLSPYPKFVEALCKQFKKGGGEAVQVGSALSMSMMMAKNLSHNASAYAKFSGMTGPSPESIASIFNCAVEGSKNADSRVRSLSAGILGQSPSAKLPEAKEILRGLLNDSDIEVSKSAAQALQAAS